MERKEYLDRCQKVAVLPQGVCGTKQNVPDELCVLYQNIKWYPFLFAIGFDEVTGAPVDLAILHDLNCNSVKWVKLKNVKEVEND